VVSPVIDAIVDVIDPRAGWPIEHAISEEEVEWWLGLLDREGGLLRTIASLKGRGHSNAEIGSELIVSVSTIERMLREIRSILKPYMDDDQ